MAPNTVTGLARLPDNLYSPEQLKACGLEMEQLIAWKRRQETKQRSGSVAATNLDFSLSEELSALLGSAENASTLPITQLEGWQSQLQEWLKQPVAHVTFAVPAPNQTKQAIIRWLRAEILPTALVKFNVNRNIVGGMVVRTPNKIFDFSFRRQLTAHKDRIPEILKRV